MAETGGVPDFPHERLDVYRAARSWVREAHGLAAALPRGQGHFADQLRRASVSVLLNLGEGLARDGADVARFAVMARGSATECAVILDALLDAGLLTEERHGAGRSLLVRIAQMLGGLRRGARGRQP